MFHRRLLAWSNPSRQMIGARRIGCVVLVGWLLATFSGGAFGQPAAVAGHRSLTRRRGAARRSHRIYADGSAYACSSAGIKSAYAALPSSGGTVDARGCQGAQRLGGSLTFTSLTKPATLLFGDATWTASAGVTVTIGGIGTKLIGAGRGRTIFKFANATADGFVFSGTNAELRGFTINMTSTGTGRALHVTAAEASGIYDIEAENAASATGHGVFLDPGTNSCERLRMDEIYAHHNGGNGFYLKAVQNNTSCALVTIGTLEAHDNGLAGFKSQGFDASTCNNGLTVQKLRTINNGGDGVEWVQECDQTVLKLETEGNRGAGWSADSHSADLWIMDYDATGNGNNAPAVSGNRIYYSGANTVPHFVRSALITGGMAGALSTKSSDYTLATTDSWINATGTTTITLPHDFSGYLFHVFNAGSGTVTVQCDSGSINGGAAITLAANTGKTVTADGANCFAH